MSGLVPQTAERPASFATGGALCCQARPRHGKDPTCLAPRQGGYYLRQFGRCSGCHARSESRDNVGRRNASHGVGREGLNVRRATDHTGRGRRRDARYEGRSSGLTSKGGILSLPRARNEKRPTTSSPGWCRQKFSAACHSSLVRAPTPVVWPSRRTQRGGGETVVCPRSAREVRDA